VHPEQQSTGTFTPSYCRAPSPSIFSCPGLVPFFTLLFTPNTYDDTQRGFMHTHVYTSLIHPRAPHSSQMTPPPQVGDQLLLVSAASAVLGDDMWPASDLQRTRWAINNRAGKVSRAVEGGGCCGCVAVCVFPGGRRVKHKIRTDATSHHAWAVCVCGGWGTQQQMESYSMCCFGRAAVETLSSTNKAGQHVYARGCIVGLTHDWMCVFACTRHTLQQLALDPLPVLCCAIYYKYP